MIEILCKEQKEGKKEIKKLISFNDPSFLTMHN
jgi:hypothetical protein